MALVPSVLAGQIESALIKAKANPSPMAMQQLSQELAGAIDSYLRAATVNTTVTGTALGGLCVAGGPVGPLPGGPPGAIVTAQGVGLPGVGLA